MARTNKARTRKPVFTHQGGKAVAGITPVEQLRRSVMSCMLFEGEFYEDGQSIADRILATAKKVKPEELAEIAVEARSEHNLRHVPLVLLTALAKVGSGRTDGLVASTIAQTIQRADELGELLAVYKKMNGGKRAPLAGQVKKGLAQAFQKFDEHQLAKYNRNKGEVEYTLKDVLFLSHAEPKSREQARIWKRLAKDKLKVPDTWEVALSGGADAKETFTRLIEEGELGYFALLRNLRKMTEAGVSKTLINKAIRARKNGAHRILPFRFTAAARAAPDYERAIDDALCANIEAMPALPGETLVLVDVSGSMNQALSTPVGRRPSGLPPLTRMDAAATLAAVINAETAHVYTFSNRLMKTKARRGMAGVEEIINSQPHQGTALGAAVREAQKLHPDFDRIIVISDEQAADLVRSPVTVRSEQAAYMINVGSYQNGVGYRNGWIHIDGFSESVLKYIAATEGLTE